MKATLISREMKKRITEYCGKDDGADAEGLYVRGRPEKREKKGKNRHRSKSKN